MSAWVNFAIFQLMKKILNYYFELEKNRTDIKTEFIAGATTFMTMAYIIFVNPAILSAPDGSNMDFGAVTVATCFAAAFATLMMGFTANYPIALAPGMGLNAFFSFVVCGKMGVPWQTALGIVFISGVIFTLLSASRIRELIVNSIPQSLKMASAAGIGLFIAFIGLKSAGFVVSDTNTFITLGALGSAPTLLSLTGLIILITLSARKIKGAILISILFTGIIGISFGMIEFKNIVGTADLSKTFFKLDIIDIFQLKYLAPILIFLFFDMFDTIGTLVGVGEQAGFIKDGKLPRGNRALVSDSVGTIAGSLLGTSTVTSYIESSAGISSGGRTGLANVFTALFFITALFFVPLAEMFGAGYKVSENAYLYPVTAPALIVVGSLMMGNVRKIQWNDITEAFPAFLTIILMPLTFSIAEGLAAGFVFYAFLKLVSGRSHEANWLVYGLSLILILRYIFL